VGEGRHASHAERGQEKQGGGQGATATINIKQTAQRICLYFNERAGALQAQRLHSDSLGHRNGLLDSEPLLFSGEVCGHLALRLGKSEALRCRLKGNDCRENLNMSENSQEVDLSALAELQSLGPSGDKLVLDAVEGLSDRKDK
jgi:hypothetical protein